MKKYILGLLCFLLLVNLASAEQCVIDSITTNPDHPAYKGSEYSGMYMSYFTIIVHVTNPPPGGRLCYTNCEYYGETTIDDNGMASFSVNLHNDIAYWHVCPTRFILSVYDNQQNLVSRAEKNIEIDMVRTPIINWNPPVDISTRTPLSSIFNAVATRYWGYSVP